MRYNDRMKIKYGLWMLLAVLGLGVAIVLAPLPRIVQDYPPAQVTAAHHPRSVAVVLGAKTKDNLMSNALRARVDTAIEIYQSGQVAYLLFTGGFRDKDPARELSEAELARDYAMTHGIPTERIRIETISVDTRSNLTEAQKIIDREQFSPVLLVSDRWHLARATMMARDMGLNIIPVPTARSAFVSLGAKLRFIVNEWVKIQHYQYQNEYTITHQQ